MDLVIVVPWYLLIIPAIVFVVWVFGVVFILEQYKKTWDFQRRSLAAKKGWLSRKWKKFRKKGKNNDKNKKAKVKTER